VRIVASGISHTLALTQVTGKIYAFGLNSSGQLGTGTKGNNSYIPLPIKGIDPMRYVSAGSFSASLSMENGELYQWGLHEILAPRKVPNLVALAKISIGNRFAAALSEDGLLFSWGTNSQGQLG
jgi:alpha-tubulin suppressor-like RCC1 family protein